MALTRNDWCVHERHGRYQDIQADGPVGLVLGPDIDLRVFFSCWRSAWAVEQDGRYSLQFFDGEGVAVHKVYRTEATDVAAYDALVARHAGPSRWPESTPAAPASDAASVADGEQWRAAWLGMKDTHEFFPLLRKFKITRLAALAAAGEDLAQQVPADAVERALESAAASGLSIMCFVGNRGMIQITGPVRQLRRTGPWYNVLDPKFNLHLDTTAIASSWVVNKPTSDGWVTSLELYAANGDLIAQFFGERKPGKPELPGWRELMAACAPCRWPYEDMPMMRKTPMPRPFSGWFARVRSPRRLPARLSAVAAAWLAGLCVAQAAPERVVTLGGSVTEIVYGLGQGRAAGRRRPVQPVSARSPPAAQRGLLPRRAGRGRAVAQAGSGAGFRSRPVRRTRSSAWARSACAW